MLDRVPHTLLGIGIEPSRVHVVAPPEVPDPSWLRPGTVGRAQQRHGDALLDGHPLVVLPSAVSTRSWNLLIDVTSAAGLFALEEQVPFALDPRLAEAARA
jgi:RES domain-containing protein